MFKVFCLFDNKAEAFGVPVYYKTNEEFEDALKALFRGEDFRMVNPLEHEVFELGTFDSTDGKHDLLDVPRHAYNVNVLISKDRADQAKKQLEGDSDE